MGYPSPDFVLSMKYCSMEVVFLDISDVERGRSFAGECYFISIKFSQKYPLVHLVINCHILLLPIATI
ncbi:hypothetical protein OLMES_4967 [Oleiphilus messinensis]|uniref:Uncharacterized protein n=1 Tax=Oleiphilus messinensis TaxID=141451 RepID=A0A1Y0IHU1_9GAMM|nr:hypothetical protein OLMES_4967 [Oleiphilus messinensis]